MSPHIVHVEYAAETTRKASRQPVVTRIFQALRSILMRCRLAVASIFRRKNHGCSQMTLDGLFAQDMKAERE
jgi:hypothetical protein